MGSSGRQISSTDILDGTIVNADVAAAAGVLVSKLAAGGTANRVVRTTDGTTMSLGQVATAMIAADVLCQTGTVAVGPPSPQVWSSAGFVSITDLAVTLTVTAGSLLLYLASLGLTSSVGSARVQTRVIRTDTGVMLGWSAPMTGAPAASTPFAHHILGVVVAPVTGSLTLAVQAQYIDASTVTALQYEGSLHVAEFKRGGV